MDGGWCYGGGVHVYMWYESNRVGSNLNIAVADGLASRVFSEYSHNTEKISIILSGFKNEAVLTLFYTNEIR